MDKSLNTTEEINWDTYAECYDALLHLVPYVQLMETLQKTVLRSAPRKVLDAGCGTGNLTSLLQKNLPKSAIFGVDLSPAMLKLAAKKLGATVQFQNADLNKELPFPDTFFDSIVSNNVLYAVPDPEFTLRQLHKVLCLGGQLVLATPKKSFDSGLILKAHCRSQKSDTYWARPHTSREREIALTNEALDNDEVIAMMLYVAYHNRIIAATASFHFFEETELLRLLAKVGFTVGSIIDTYADQSYLVTATRKD